MFSSLTTKLLKIFSWCLMIASIVFTVVFFLRIFKVTPSEQLDVAGTFIIWAYILLGLGVVFTLVLPLINFILNPKNIKGVLISLVFMAVIFVVSYLMADTTPLVTATSATDLNFSNPTVLKFTDTGLFATYLLFVISLLLLLLTGLKGVIKR